jgi:RNA polymerase sigma-70 factor (ECF subfamily)
VRIDPAVVAALHAAHATELRAFLWGVLKDNELAEETVQVTFGKLIEAGPAGPGESLKGWLFRVAYREALMLRRRQKVEQRSLSWLAKIVRPDPDPPERRQERKDQIERVRRAIAALSREQQIVVEKRIYEQKTFTVIASELGIPLGTALTRMRAALGVLRRNLESDER